MPRKTTVALLISTYNWPQALKAVFESILAQTILPDEILVADDGSDASTKKLIDNYRKKFAVPLKHFWQPNNGFQKAVIVNKAVAGTDCDYIVQIDGDILLNRHFIEDHLAAAQPHHFIRGSRAMLSEYKTAAIIKYGHFKNIAPFARGLKNRINALRIPAVAAFFDEFKKRSDNMHGCNCAFWRKDFVRVNGYNNSFKGWGHEDAELAARFINAGLIQKKIKLRAVCYHMHHAYADRCSVETNYRVYQESVKTGTTRCLNGYSQHYTYQDQYRLNNLPSVEPERARIRF